MPDLLERIGGLLIAAVLLALGVFTACKAGGRLVAAIDSWGWVETPCTVVDAWVDAEKRTVEASFAYTWEGREYRGDRYAHESPFASDGHGTWGALQEVVPGTRRSCFVDPSRPERSVLIRDRWWIQVILGSMTVFGLGLILGGVWLLASVLLTRTRQASTAVSGS